MRLKSLRLQSYRTHQDSTLNIGDATFVVVRGPNGGGKTSFADAFSMNTTSTTVSLPSDGKGFLSKLYQVDGKSADKHIARLEKELLKEINSLGIGPMGLGGHTTAIGVNILEAPTHIAGLPVAVNVSCHATRSAERVI